MLDLEALTKEIHEDAPLPENIVVLGQTNQLRAMSTMIRDQECDREDFVFYLERTSSLVLER
jgi:uridine kinase